MARSIWSFAPPVAGAGTRERLLDAAALLFYEHGFHAVGIDRIFGDVGVTKTTFYNHFESKDALIVALLEHRDRHDMEALRAELQRRGGPPRERLLAVFDVLDDWFRDEGFRGCLFVNAATQFPNPHDPVHVAALRHHQHLLEALTELARAAGATDAELLAQQLNLLVSAALNLRHVVGDLQAARTARGMAEVLVDDALGGASRPAK
jgi:AcrR family transcriptional regulator